MRPWSVAARAGVQVISGLVGNVTIPRTTTTSTGHWLELESSQVTESQSTLGRVALAPKTAVSTANAEDASIAAVTTPAVRKLLSGRERASCNGFIWDSGRVARMPGLATPSVPTASMLVGDFSLVVLGLWGPGFIGRHHRRAVRGDPRCGRASSCGVLAVGVDHVSMTNVKLLAGPRAFFAARQRIDRTPCSR